MTSELILKEENIAQQIFLIRGEKVMLDFDLAQMYQVETKALKQAVKRNLESFPSDFMFELTVAEFKILRSQIVTSSWGGSRYLPMAFTEQGVSMLSGVLKSKRARQVNIAIMRAFVKMRKFFETHRDLETQLKKLESRMDKHDEAIKTIFEAIRLLMQPPNSPRKKIGFKIGKKK
jgi:hypothetical protein